MSKFKVTREFSGYCRGVEDFLIEAASEEEAKENYWDGVSLGTEIIRDDTETQELYVEEVSQ